MVIFSAPRSVAESDENESASEIIELDDSLEELERDEHLIADDLLTSSATNEDTLDQSDEAFMSSDQSGSEFSDSEEGSASQTESTTEGDEITMMSLASVREGLEKGKAAKEQVCKPLRSARDCITIQWKC